MYLLCCNSSALPRYLETAVDVFWSDVSGSLLLGMCQTLANLSEPVHFFSVAVIVIKIYRKQGAFAMPPLVDRRAGVEMRGF